MGVTLRLTNYDRLFNNLSTNKIIVNDFNYYNHTEMETVQKVIFTVYNSDIMDVVPTCDCGATTGGFMLNKICPHCNTEVLDPNENKAPVLWLKSLLPNVKMINLTYYNMLKRLLDSRHIDYVRWMIDYKYNPPVQLHNWIYGVKDILGERSYTNFINKQEDILIYLINNSHFKDQNKNDKLKQLLHIWKHHHEDVLTNVAPLINKKLFVMEKTNKGKYIDLTVSLAIDTVVSWIKAASDMDMKDRYKDRVMGVGISKLAELASEYEEAHLGKKPGVFRKHVYAARSHFTFRGVITPIVGPHKYNEIHLPWSIAVTAMRPHILNKLDKLGYTYKQANRMLYESVKVYNPVIASIMDDMINDCQYPGMEFPGIPIIGLRNPGLLRGSTEAFTVSVIKKDPTDMCIGFPILSIKSMNGDWFLVV